MLNSGHRRAATILALLILAPLIAGASSRAHAGDGDPVAGEALFSRCSACHEVGGGTRTRLGPHLEGLFGRAAGAVEGFRYSRAMTAAGADGLTWDAERLDAFLESPRTFLRGNRMAFPGMRDAGQRADLLAYLEAATGPAGDGGADTDAEMTAGTGGTADPETLDRKRAILSMSGDAAYGQYLGGECATCHRSSGSAAGIPPIAGLPRDHFVLALVEYRAGLRDNEVMTTTASRLTDEEIAALAAYFAPE